MDVPLKQRLIGAAVLVALAVIFLPMLVQGPAPDSGVSDVPLRMPDAPDSDYVTRDLPLVLPEATPEGGAVGMPGATGDERDAAGGQPDASQPEASQPLPLDDTPAPAATNPDAAQLADAPGARPEPPPAALPATAAGGDYAVGFGSFTTAAAADKVVAALRASQLPGYRESATVAGKVVQRVRIGPYATRADAEIARLRATHVRDDMGAQVIVLDAGPAPVAAAPKPAAKPAVKPAAPPPAPVAAAQTGFAVQVGAFSKAADALALRDKLRQAGFSAFTEAVATDHGTLTRVRVGPVAERAEADQLAARVKARLGIDGLVRPHP